MDKPPWKDGYEFNLSLDRFDNSRTFSFLSRDGVRSKTEIMPAELGLLKTVDLDFQNGLILDANYGIVGTVLGSVESVDEITMVETSSRLANCCQVNGEKNDITCVDTAVVPWAPEEGKEYDVLTHTPKQADPIQVGRERLVCGLKELIPGGRCYVAGTETSGIKRYAKTLRDCCTDVQELPTEVDCHVYTGVRPSNFDPPKFIEKNEFRATVDGFSCQFITQPGLFSWRELDAGTKLLLQQISVADKDRVLDLACGYGAIGAFLGGRTDCNLYATDDNVIATRYAQQNYERNGVAPVAVKTGDCLDAFPDQQFDVIVSNPPTHAGSGVTMKLFESVQNALASDGEFWLVYNEIMQYEYVLREKFAFEVDIVASVDKFTVARAIL